MDQKEYVVFSHSDTGIRQDRIIAWMPDPEGGQDDDKNGNPVRHLVFSVAGHAMTGDYTVMVKDVQDIKRFLAGAWNQGLLVKMLLEMCEKALEHLDAEYNEGNRDDPRPHWGENQELDDLHNEVSRMIALVKGEPFIPRE